jgi:hypothetical protein
VRQRTGLTLNPELLSSELLRQQGRLRVLSGEEGKSGACLDKGTLSKLSLPKKSTKSSERSRRWCRLFVGAVVMQSSEETAEKEASPFPGLCRLLRE